MFRTYEPTRDRLVAVKVFRLDVIPEQAKALADELARAADAGLFHPSIVEPIAAGVEGTVAYRAEEYVAAESLDVAMRHYAPAPLDKALPFITQLAGAIDFARAAGVGHGALHPRDIFVTPDEARATGFGVAEALERVGLRAPVRRPYSPPERIAGEAWSTPADVFSLAAIAYELLTGTRPSGTGEHIGSLDGSHAGDDADRLHAVLARAMHDEPGRRYSSALGFAAALEAAARGDVAAVAAPPPGSAGSKRSAGSKGSTGSKGSAGSKGSLNSGVLSGSAGSEVPASSEVPVGSRIPTSPELPASAGVLAAAQVPSSSAESRRAPEPEPPEPTEPPEPVRLNDIAVERDEDEAHFALMREEGERDRFVDDFVESDRGEPEPAAVEIAASEDARAFAPMADEVRSDSRAAAAAGGVPGAAPTVFAGTITEGERRGSDMLPRAIFLVVGLLIGFLAGNFVGGRDRERPPEPAVTSAEPVSPDSTETSAQQGKAWSDQRVGQQPQTAAQQPGSPPASPPPVPTEAAAPSEGASTAAAPAAAKPTTGTIVVRSTPAGAAVTVNGRWRGRTPLTLSDLRFGSYTVRVVQPGYVVAREDIRLSAGDPSHTMSVQLRRPARASAPEETAPPRTAPRRAVGAGSIYVNSRPPKARVFLDGKFVGVTPLRLRDVQAGSHTVRMELEEHRTWIDTKYVLGGQETTFTGSLERIR